MAEDDKKLEPHETYVLAKEAGAPIPVAGGDTWATLAGWRDHDKEKKLKQAEESARATPQVSPHGPGLIRSLTLGAVGLPLSAAGLVVTNFDLAKGTALGFVANTIAIAYFTKSLQKGVASSIMAPLEFWGFFLGKEIVAAVAFTPLVVDPANSVFSDAAKQVTKALAPMTSRIGAVRPALAKTKNLLLHRCGK